MFANNQKISVRQVKRLLVMDWIGKICLLLPGYAARTSERNFILGILAGLGLTLLYTVVVCRLTAHITVDFSQYIDERLGRGVSFMVSLIFWGYVFINLLYITRMFGAIAGEYMLPELTQNILCILLLLGGFYAAYEPRERRGRIGEVLYPVVLVPLFLILFIALFGVKAEHFTAGKADFKMETLNHVFQVFTAFGGISILLFEASNIQKERKQLLKAVIKAVLVTGVSVLALFLIGIGSFGEQGMRALKWPIIALAGNVQVPGGFLQRFDILFLALLLFSFFVAAGTGIYFLKKISRGIIRRGEERSYGIPILILSCAGAIGCKNADVAFRLFCLVGCYILIPLMTGIVLILAVLEVIKRRRTK